MAVKDWVFFVWTGLVYICFEVHHYCTTLIELLSVLVLQFSSAQNKASFCATARGRETVTCKRLGGL